MPVTTVKLQTVILGSILLVLLQVCLNLGCSGFSFLDYEVEGFIFIKVVSENLKFRFCGSLVVQLVHCSIISRALMACNAL